MCFANFLGNEPIDRFADQVRHFALLRNGDCGEFSMGLWVELGADILEFECHLCSYLIQRIWAKKFKKNEKWAINTYATAKELAVLS
jgi:hypothetical protein